MARAFTAEQVFQESKFVTRVRLYQKHTNLFIADANSKRTLIVFGIGFTFLQLDLNDEFKVAFALALVRKAALNWPAVRRNRHFSALQNLGIIGHPQLHRGTAPFKSGRRDGEVKARKFITAGYQRLLTFEVPGGGFDWFGRPPANEILTAYGILEFSDMAKVHNVDQAVINWASQWLMSKQQSDGSWKPQRWHDISDDIKATAYIAWALTEAGQHGKELDAAFTYLR